MIASLGMNIGITILMVYLRRGRSPARQAPTLTKIAFHIFTIEYIVAVAGLNFNEHFPALRRMKNGADQILAAS